jgi:hypothetical protein
VRAEVTGVVTPLTVLVAVATTAWPGSGVRAEVTGVVTPLTVLVAVATTAPSAPST